jgi:hypothetical protein
MQQAEEFHEVVEMPEVPRVAEHEDEPQMFQEASATLGIVYENEWLE